MDLHLEESPSVMSDGILDQIPAAIAILAATSLIGCLGNALVLFVYAQKAHKQTASLFIFVLGLVDFFTCLLVIPFTMANEYLLWRIDSTVLCKAYYVLNTSNVSFSSLLISAVAVDRYLCICHPFLRAMTVPRAKAIVLVLALFSLTVGSMAAHFAEMRTMPSDNNNNITMTTAVAECSDYSSLEPQHLLFNSSGHRPAELLFFDVIHKLNHACFAFCILCVLVLYVLIYRSILRVRRKRKSLKGIPLKLQQQREFSCVSNGDEELLTVQASSAAAGGYQPRHSVAGRRRRSIRQLRDSETFQNMKTAMILFVVAMVFIVTFSPAILMGNKVIPLQLAVFYLYYLNNAANPIIYGFMNKNFRSDVKKIFHQCCFGPS